MAYQDWTKRFQQQQSEQLTLPEYDLPTQIEDLSGPAPIIGQGDTGAGRSFDAAVERRFARKGRLPEQMAFETQEDLQNWKPKRGFDSAKELGTMLKIRKATKGKVAKENFSTVEQYNAWLRSQQPKPQPQKAKTGISQTKVPPKTGTETSAVGSRDPLKEALNFREVSPIEEAQKITARAWGEPPTLASRLPKSQPGEMTELEVDFWAENQRRRIAGQPELPRPKWMLPASKNRTNPLIQMGQRQPITVEDRRLATEFALTQMDTDEQMARSEAAANQKVKTAEAKAKAANLSPERKIFNQFSRGFIGMGTSALQGMAAGNPIVAESVERDLSKLDPYLDEYLPVDPTDENFFGAKLPQGAGSAAGFAVAGLLSRGAGIGAMLGSSMLGAASNTGSAYQEARAKGLSPAKAGQSVGAAPLIGSLEGIMGGEASTGRALTRTGRSAIKAEAKEEFWQEATSDLLNDVNARFIGGYDQDRKIGGTALESGLMGGILGAGMAVPHVALQKLAEARSPNLPLVEMIEAALQLQPEHPVIQNLVQAGIDPAAVKYTNDDRALDVLSRRLQAQLRVQSRIQQLQEAQPTLQQQALNAQDAQRMGRVPSVVDQQQAQQLPIIEQQLEEAYAAQDEILEDLQTLSPFFAGMAQEMTGVDVEPLNEIQDELEGDLLGKVRQAGGMNAQTGVIEKGELDRLGPKESGTTGLIRRDEGGLTPDEMREQMRDEGVTQAETPQEFINEVEQATKRATKRKEQEEFDSYEDYARSQLTEAERADAEKLDTLLSDRANSFTIAYRTLDDPRNVYSPKTAREFVQAATEQGFSDHWIERQLVDFQSRRGLTQKEPDSPISKVAEVEVDRPVTKGAAPGVSMSPYKILQANNADLLQTGKGLYKVNLNSEEGKAGIARLRQYARDNNIEQRHVNAHISDIQNWQLRYGVPNAQPSQSANPVTPQPASKTTPRRGFSLEQRQLLGAELATVTDEDFDSFLNQLEQLQDKAIKGHEVELSQPEYNALRSKLMDARSERAKRVKAKRLKALHERTTKPNPPGWKVIYGQRMVEQARRQREAQAEADRQKAGTADRIDEQAHEAATSPKNDLPEPTQAQIEAGNYKKGHVSWSGLDITIENPKGSKRSGPDWEVTMSAHYGYIRRTVGADEEQIDAYIGDNPESQAVFVVDQIDPKTGKFDEHKVILGTNSIDDAKSLYDAHFDDGSGPKRRGAISTMPLEEFKEWLKTEDSTKPVRYQEDKQEGPAYKIGDMVTFTGPVIQYKDGKPFTAQKKVVGRITEIRWNGDLYVRLQTGGYRTIKPSEVTKAAVSGSGMESGDAVPEDGNRQETEPAELDGDRGQSVGSVESLPARVQQVLQLLNRGESLVGQLSKLFNVKPGTVEMKAVEEDVEFAGVLAAREIVARGNPPKQTYADLLHLHYRMPTLGTRTSESVQNQAYSTPLPIAYVASRLAGITKKTSVYEPTGGNGVLVIEASPKNTIINDLNPKRVENLRAQGFDANIADATKVSLTQLVDAVIANPPFGVVKEDGQSKRFKTPFGTTTEIDHAIAFQALEQMKAGGRAVLIVGSVPRQLKTQKARSDAYNTAAKRLFYADLYDTYNVVDHFTVAGELYAKQGAAWPVDVIIIEGRGKSKRKYPAAQVPEVISSYEQLGEKLLDSDGRQSISERGEQQTSGSERLPVSNDGATGDNAEPGSRPATGGGRRSRPVPSGGNSGKSQRSGVDAEPASSGTVSATGGKLVGEGSSQAESSLFGEGVQQDSSSEVGGSTLGGNGRTSNLSQVFEEEFADMFGDSESQAVSREQMFEEEFADMFGESPKTKKSTEPRKSREPKARTESKTSQPKVEAPSDLKGAADALIDLFSPPTALRGPATALQQSDFDEATYRKAKPLFQTALGSFSDVDDRTAIRKLLEYLKANYGEKASAAIYRMKPYILRFVEERAAASAPKAEPVKAEPVKPEPVKAEPSKTHSPYKPLSRLRSLDVTVPRNMANPVETALDAFEQEYGLPDKYVAEKLGYDYDEMVEKGYFSAEQVDAVALAISNIEKGKGFVIGDQTGIGKGRINAAIIRYAIKNGKTPVFVTQKPALYADMIRDLKNIGMSDIQPLITNAETIPLNAEATEWMQEAAEAKANGLRVPPEPSGAKFFRPKSNHKDNLRALASGGKLPKGFQVVFTTYDQMNPDGGQFVKERHLAVFNATQGGVLIMDESHTAGGDKKGRGRKKDEAGKRSKFFRHLVKVAASVFYSSATYAKRPDIMDLYSKTDLGVLGQSSDRLANLFSRGGVALQQVVAAKLTQAGQYLRRERTFEGIKYEPQVVEVDKGQAESLSGAMRMINAFDKAKRAAVENLKDEVKSEASLVSEDGSTGRAGVESTNFTSLMHNVIDQMLLGLKADLAADLAIEALKRGEKPVVTVSNTMESFLQDAGVQPGEAADLTFKDVMLRYLVRSRNVTIKNRDGHKTKRPLTDDELGKDALAAYKAAHDFIMEASFADLPISPIDRVRERIKAAGYRVDEITGRSTQVDSTGKIPILRTRSAFDKKVAGRRRVIGDFNNGRTDALILNQSGSTGISLHASPDEGADLKPRHMIIWQAEKNIDTHMQMLGRINRTGQVNKPRYTQMIANVPAEKRPAAVLLKKMASLNANTTASRKSSIQAEGVTDFMNELGDQVIARIVRQDQELNAKLGYPIQGDSETDEVGEAARKVTGRIPLLTLAEQEELYNQIETEYADYLAQKEAMGENPLEAKTEDFQAETLHKEVLTEGVPGSPFSEPAYLERVRIKKTVQPYSSAEVMKMVRENVGVSEGATEPEIKEAARKKISDYIRSASEAFNQYEKSLAEQDDGFDLLSDAMVKALWQKAQTIANHWGTVIRVVAPGTPITINTKTAGAISGVVLDVVKRGKPRNPYQLSAWGVRVAVLDGRELRFGFNELVTSEGVLQVGRSSEVSRLNQETGMFEYRPILPEFDNSRGTKTQVRYIVTGNIVAGFSKLPKGQILNYTNKEGDVLQGVLMPVTFDAASVMAEMPVELVTADQVSAYLDEVLNGKVQNPEQEFSLSRDPRGLGFVMSTVGSKKIGGKFFLNKGLTAITGQFAKGGGGGVYKAIFERNKLADVVNYLREDMGVTLQVIGSKQKEQAKKILEQQRTDAPKGPPLSLQVKRGQNVYKVSASVFDLKTGKSRKVDLEVAAHNRTEAKQKAIDRAQKSYPAIQMRLTSGAKSLSGYTVEVHSVNKLGSAVRWSQGETGRQKDTERRQLEKMLVGQLEELGYSKILAALRKAEEEADRIGEDKAIVDVLRQLRWAFAGSDSIESMLKSFQRNPAKMSLDYVPNPLQKLVRQWLGVRQGKGYSVFGPPTALKPIEKFEAESQVKNLISEAKPVLTWAESQFERREELENQYEDAETSPEFLLESSKIENDVNVRVIPMYAKAKAAYDQLQQRLDALEFEDTEEEVDEAEGEVERLEEELREAESETDRKEIQEELKQARESLKAVKQLNKQSLKDFESLEETVLEIQSLVGELEEFVTFEQSPQLQKLQTERDAAQPRWMRGEITYKQYEPIFERYEELRQVELQRMVDRQMRRRGPAASLGLPRAKELANPLDVILYSQMIVKDRGKKGVRVYMNDHLRFLIGNVLKDVFGMRHFINLWAANLSRQEVQNIASFLTKEVPRLKGEYKEALQGLVNRLKQLLTDYPKQQSFNFVDTTAYMERHLADTPTERQEIVDKFKGIVREETFHGKQRAVSGDTPYIVGVSWAQSSKGYGKWRKALVEEGYPDHPEVIAAEAAAKIAAGLYGQLGIRTEADHELAQAWLASYFERIAVRHGIAALDNFTSLLPPASAAREKGKQNARENFERKLQESATGRAGAGTDEPGTAGGGGERVRKPVPGKPKDSESEIRRPSPDEPFEGTEKIKGPQQVLGGTGERFNRENVRQPGEAPPAETVTGGKAGPQQPLPGLPNRENVRTAGESAPTDETFEGTEKIRGPQQVLGGTGERFNRENVRQPGEAPPPDVHVAPFVGSPEQQPMFDDMGKPKPFWSRFWANVADLYHVPKSLMSGGEISATLRQGFFLTVPPTQWKAASKAFKNQIKALSKVQFEKIVAEIKRHPAYRDAIAAGQYFSSNDTAGTPLSEREEAFLSRFAGRIPWVRLSEQTYKAYLDTLRIETFARYKRVIDKQFRSPEERFEAYQAAAEWLNISTGRGQMRGKFGEFFDQANPFLNVFFYAPRYTLSRLQMINPWTYLRNLEDKQKRVIFRQQMAEMFQTAAVLATTGAVALGAGATIGWDEDDADFLKLRFGTTRYDILAGLQQVARLGVQIGSWVKSEVGEEDEKQLKDARADLIGYTGKYIRTKLGPIPGFVYTWLKNWREVTGEVHKPGVFITEWRNGNTNAAIGEFVNDPMVARLIPIFWRDLVDAYQQGWERGGVEGGLKQTVLTLPAGLGINVQDYDRPEYRPGTRKILKDLGMEPGYPKRKEGENEKAYQHRVKAHIEKQEDAISRFYQDENISGQSPERVKKLLQQEIDAEGMERMSKIRLEDVEDDRMVRAWIQAGHDRLKSNPVFLEMSEIEQQKAIRSYYGRMNKFKAQPKNSTHGYQKPEIVTEKILTRKIKESLEAQRGN